MGRTDKDSTYLSDQGNLKKPPVEKCCPRIFSPSLLPAQGERATLGSTPWEEIKASSGQKMAEVDVACREG